MNLAENIDRSLIWHLTQFSALIVHRLTFIFWFVQAQWRRRKIIDSWYRQTKIVLGRSLGRLESCIFQDSFWTRFKKTLWQSAKMGSVREFCQRKRDCSASFGTSLTESEAMGHLTYRLFTGGCDWTWTRKYKSSKLGKYWKTENGKETSLFTHETCSRYAVAPHNDAQAKHTCEAYIGKQASYGEPSLKCSSNIFLVLTSTEAFSLNGEAQKHTHTHTWLSALIVIINDGIFQ